MSPSGDGAASGHAGGRSSWLSVLREVEAGRLSSEQALQILRSPSSRAEALQASVPDLDRGRRLGFPEVIYGEGKRPDDLVRIAEELLITDPRLLVTRANAEQFRALSALELKDPRGLPIEFVWHERARAISLGGGDDEERSEAPRIGVLCAGTTDLPVAEEAALTAELGGLRVDRHYDVGVAGLHRLLGRLDDLETCELLIVVAGMEGALPSVVGGLFSKPVIAVPTSVGYGASFEGLAALLGMLSSCAPGVLLVNIDNGFGAGDAAVRWRLARS